ncbi:uncharacterized protein C8Q71DRAFT_427196 [Rhodofomes roseus]|uniref:Uncharacterized protein n=1 Tax=Rhodofomes roseus TaxID=34475 RepID=A0ABQ8KQF7_9APHY|nr:uncharacterized protein C8Q71DRAFT_427196 [Rhodofomes roseus]KAH9840862.1 hypothetical protein C8Q71DRAFT_427196 [Rhodofomes roseus]
MRSVFLAFLVVFFATGVVAHVARVSRREELTLNPTNVHVKYLAHATRTLTNAQRLARGLTPARPKFRSNRRLANRGLPSQTPTTTSTPSLPTPPTSSASPASSTDTAASTSADTTTISTGTTSASTDTTSTATAATTSAAPTPSCTAYVGLLQVSGGSYTGQYISSESNNFGEYTTTGDSSKALQVQYQECANEISYTSINLRTLNGLSDYTNLAAIVGFANINSNLAVGSYNYAYIGGSQGESSPNAPAQSGANSFTAASGTVKPFESDIWTIDPSTSVVTAQWVNTDGSKPTTYIVISDGVILLTADVTRFAMTYGATTSLTVKFVHQSTSAVPVTTIV